MNAVQKWARVKDPDILRLEIIRLETELLRLRQKIAAIEQEKN